MARACGNGEESALLATRRDCCLRGILVVGSNTLARVDKWAALCYILHYFADNVLLLPVFIHNLRRCSKRLMSLV